MNTELGQNAKNDFGKDIFNLMNNAVLGKAIENMGKNRDIKLTAPQQEEIQTNKSN